MNQLDQSNITQQQNWYKNRFFPIFIINSFCELFVLDIFTHRLTPPLTLWVQCIVHLRSTFSFLPSKLIRRYVVLYALVHYEKAVFIECSTVYIVTEPNVN